MSRIKKVKLIAFLMSVASCLFIFSVGFSTWYNVSYPTVPPESGAIETYDVLTIENAGMDMFKFSMFSFKTANYDDEGNLTKFEDSEDGTGVITVTYRVSADTLEPTKGTFRVDMSLGYDGDSLSSNAKVEGFEGLFQSFGNGTNSVVVTCAEKDSVGNSVAVGERVKVNETDDEAKDIISPTEIKSAYQFTGVTANKTVTINNKTVEVYEFTVTYTFTIPRENDNFKNTFGQYLNGTDVSDITGTKFIATAHVSK